MVLGIIVFVFACCGIYGFYNNLYVLTYIGFVFVLFECILGRIEGTLKSMQTTIIAGIIGWIIVQDFWLGIAIGACFENVIMFIGGCLMIFLFSISTSKLPKENNPSTPTTENTVDIIQETINNSKKDLETGVKKEQLDEMLENGYITQEVYDETLMNIKKLEMIANFNIDELKQIQNNISEPSNDEYDEDLEEFIDNDDENN